MPDRIKDARLRGSSDRDTSIIETTYDPAPRGSPAIFRHVTGDAPVCEPNDRMAARMYLARIEQALKLEALSAIERSNLYRARNKWRARAEGKDARYVVAGNKPGRPKPGIQARIQMIESPMVAVRNMQAARMRAVRESNPLVALLPPEPRRDKLVLDRPYREMTWDQIRALHR